MTFRPDEWARVKEVFEGARTLAVADRRAFVASACAGEAALQEHVEKLLAAHQLASSFPETRTVISHDGSVTTSLDGLQVAGYEIGRASCRERV